MNSKTSITTGKEAPVPDENAHIEHFKFTGKGGEYFGIWIVNILLTILTLGIYSAWAKVRNKQYFYGNTYLDDSSFEYMAKPMQILRGRIIAVVLFLIYVYAETFIPMLGVILGLLLFLASPWIIMKALAFNAHYSQYRGIRFQFHQNFVAAAKALVLIPIAAFLPALLFFIAFAYFSINNPSGAEHNLSPIVILSLIGMLLMFLAFPFIMYISNRYLISNYAFGGEGFRFRLTTAKPYFLVFIKAAGISILIFVGLIVLTAALLSSGQADLGDLSENTMSGLMTVSSFLTIAVIGLSYAYIIAYVKANTYNLAYQNTAIAKHKLRAKMKPTDLALLYITNTLGIALTLGFFIPWAKVRTARFLADNTALQVNGDLSNFIATQREYQSAIGEEIGEVFDLDIAI